MKLEQPGLMSTIMLKALWNIENLLHLFSSTKLYVGSIWHFILFTYKNQESKDGWRKKIMCKRVSYLFLIKTIRFSHSWWEIVSYPFPYKKKHTHTNTCEKNYNPSLLTVLFPSLLTVLFRILSFTFHHSPHYPPSCMYENIKHSIKVIRCEWEACGVVDHNPCCLHPPWQHFHWTLYHLYLGLQQYPHQTQIQALIAIFSQFPT